MFESYKRGAQHNPCGISRRASKLKQEHILMGNLLEKGLKS